MVNYVKVRPYVAQRLGVEATRRRYADGNVLIWDKELRMIDPGWVFHPEETVARIGGLMMDPYRNREEQEKTADECTPLPEPTDPEWAIPEEEAAETAEEAEEVLVEIIDNTLEDDGPEDEAAGGMNGLYGEEGGEG